MGLPVRLNQAIDAASGDYFARMDADDISYPARLERQCEFLQVNPEIDLVGSWVLVFDNEGTVLGRRTGPADHISLCAHPLRGFQMAHPTYMGRMEWFRKYRYDVGMLKSQDQDLLLRSYRSSHFANIPHILLAYREESLTLRKSISSRRMLTKALAREFWTQRRPDLVFAAVLGQASKCLFEYVAIKMGLAHRMLRHRYELPSKDDSHEWDAIWTSLQGAGDVDSRIGRE
jgi:glycosyltransferase involved in cell wall biosynthesis